MTIEWLWNLVIQYDLWIFPLAIAVVYVVELLQWERWFLLAGGIFVSAGIWQIGYPGAAIIAAGIYVGLAFDRRQPKVAGQQDQ